MIVPLQEWLHRKPAGVFDVCIVGAGPAGIDLAVQLAGRRKRVLVLEGGGRAFDPRVQKLHAVRETGRPFLGGNHDFRSGETGPAREAARIRALGGTSTIWAGKWKLPDPIDFEPRPWIGAPGWPLRWSELSEHADAVMREYVVPHRLLSGPPAKVALSAIRLALHYAQHPPVDFAQRHRETLESAENITVLLDANAVELLPAPGGARVGEIVAKSLGGVTTRLAAEVFVLAVGGIETARLLLLSTRFGRNGPGNQHGHVGRNFLEHPKARLGLYQPSRAAGSAGLCGWPALARRNVVVRWTLPPDRQRALGIANHALGLVPAGARVGWPARWFRKPQAQEAFLFLEQLPNPASRVTLDVERDELGTPLAAVHWDFLPEDEAGVRKFVDALTAALAPKYGTLEVAGSALGPGGWAAGSHHMGTARMAASAADGVVDTNGQVFGVSNLFVAGSAIFPVAGNANPTLLLLALTRRLARHLSRPGPVVSG